MPLTHTALQALKPRSSTFSVSDRDGLFIDVLPSGKMVWRFKFHFEGKRPKLTIGSYPEIGLADARARRDEAAKLLANGINPAAHKQDVKQKRKIELARAFTFLKLTEKWFSSEVAKKSEKWQSSVRSWLKLDIYPAIGHKDPRDIVKDDIKALIDKVVERKARASANKVRMICWQIFEYAIREGEIEDKNPVARISAVDTPDAKNYRPLEIREIKRFLERLNAAETRLVNQIAVRLLMLTLVRKSELRLATWDEFDFVEKVWRIPAERMKMRRSHEVYLSQQVIALLEQLKALSEGNKFILPHSTQKSKPIGSTTINYVISHLNLEGARFVPHGFRSTASTILNEANYSADAVERQLAHVDPNRVRAVYNHAKYEAERREMLQSWADYIDELQRGSTLPMSRRNRL